MLDITFIRENPEIVKAGAKKKHIDIDIDKLLAVDEKRRGLLREVEDMRAKQNQVSDLVGRTADAGEKERLILDMKTLKETLQTKEKELEETNHDWQFRMVEVPNVPDPSVPDGNSDADNQEIRVWGTKPQFSFTPKSHVELMQDLDIADFERGVKVSGFRGYFLKGDGALLSFAIWRYAQDFFLKKSFIPMIVPSLVKRVAFLGTGYLPQGEEDLYKTQDGDFLAGTSEVATMSYYMNEVVPKESLPIKLLSFSPCYRREAGSHGKDTKGIMRVHEFFKFEQVVLCEASHEESVRLHEELTKNAEELLQVLEIPYHVVINCGGDLGLGQVKKYDIESWVPSENRYRETHSSSYFHDFQTRRLNIKYRDAEGKLQHAHSLNNTAIATPRILISIIENNQQADGSILIPKALQTYMGKDKIEKLAA